MAQQEEPLYDFPEPTKPSEHKFMGHQRSRGSLKSISVLDRLLLTVPVWLQLSINPATALHILQREPPGTFLVRKSRTSQRNVLCVRLADDSIPSFVQQFGIREESSSKKFWNSHLNVRGPREAPKSQENQEKTPIPETPAPPSAAPPTSSTALPDSAPHPDFESAPKSDSKPPGPGSTLFHEFCPITTRSPQELDCGSGLGALCFINPLFLQSQNPLSRRRMFKRSLKVRISTETSSLLSPPLIPAPPPPLMPKTRGRCKAQKQGNKNTQIDATIQDRSTEDSLKPPSAAPVFQNEMQEHEEAADQLQPVMENLLEDSDYMQPPSTITTSHTPSLSPYLSPSVPPMAPPIFPKVSQSFSPHDSPGASPSLSPYQSPSLSPRVLSSLSPYESPNVSPSASPSPSPQVPFSLSPFISPAFSDLVEQVYHTPVSSPRPDQSREERETEMEGTGVDEKKTNEDLNKKEEDGLVLQMSAAALSDNCSSSFRVEETAESSSQKQDGGPCL